jgi:hypothetical protein
MDRAESNEERGLYRLVPSTRAEVEIIKRVLRGMVDRTAPNGVSVAVGGHEDNGWYRIDAVAPTADFWQLPAGLRGRVSLLEREYPSSDEYRLDLAWQFNGQPEYWGGDGPVANAALLLREASLAG